MYKSHCVPVSDLDKPPATVQSQNSLKIKIDYIRYLYVKINSRKRCKKIYYEISWWDLKFIPFTMYFTSKQLYKKKISTPFSLITLFRDIWSLKPDIVFKPVLRGIDA